ncbi:hypothetical protein JCM10296v2_006686 [Rhodotorula toruloides]
MPDDQTASRKAPSYRSYFTDPFGLLLSSMNRRDHAVTFLRSKPADAFRKGARKVLDADWWAATFRGDDYLHALAVRDRLEEDEAEVGNEWLRRRDGMHNRLQAVVVICETLLGSLVYKALSAGNVVEEDWMFECGRAYGALLKCLAVPGKGFKAPGGFVYVNGKPIPTTFESLSHLQTVGDSSSFFPISRQAAARW